MKLTRRGLLSLVPAAGLLTVITPGRAAADPTDEHAALLSNMVDIVAGTAESNARPEAANKIAGITRTARDRLGLLDSAGDGELFDGLPLGTSDANLTSSYQYLYEIALATRVPGGELDGDQDVRRRVVDGLVWLHEHYYGDQSTGYYGNWFNWEIGISSHVTKTLVLLTEGNADDVDAELVRTYVASMDAYLRNGKDGDVDLDSRFHTGANLADITTNRVLQGALLGDDARVRKALTDQMTVFATIDPYDLKHGVTDGYYADGSFIQHHSVAYTGSYGKALLSRVVQTLKILDGTAYSNADNLVPVVRGWVADGFAPLIFEGWMMELVKGRAVSRTKTGYEDVTVVVEAVVDLADHAGDAATALKGYVKFLTESSPTPLNPDTFVSPVSVVRYADIVADPSIPAADLNPEARSVAFNAMDRTVHRRPGYAFALARSSDRISKYEYMSGENLMPWFTGDGAYYLYLSGQDQTQAYGVDYFTTVSPYRLAGVTAPVEERKTIPELYGTPYYDNPDHPLNFTPSSESQNTYVYFPRGTNRHSGGAVLGSYGAAGMVQSSDVGYADKQKGILPDDFVVYRNATATKSWFMFDDEIVVLAANVGDPAGRAVTTAVDARIADPADELVIAGKTRDGADWSGTGTEKLRWLRYANTTQGTALGYVFLDDHPVTVELEKVTRSLRVVRTSNPDTDVTRNVFGVTIAHPAGSAPASLAYALVPHATAKQLRGYARGPITVLANDAAVQAVAHSGLGIVAGNVFAGDGHGFDGTALFAHQNATRNVTVDGPASVIARRKGRDQVTVAVSDPTMHRDRITLEVPVRLTLVDGDDAVRVRRTPKGTRIEVDTYHAYGRSFTATLRG